MPSLLLYQQSAQITSVMQSRRGLLQALVDQVNPVTPSADVELTLRSV